MVTTLCLDDCGVINGDNSTCLDCSGVILEILLKMILWITDPSNDCILGCLDQLADNFNSDANEDDGNCVYFGCTDINAINYDSLANEDEFTNSSY